MYLLLLLAECIILLHLPQAWSIQCLAKIQLLILVAECIIFLLPQAWSIRCLAEIQLLNGGGIYNAISSPSIVNSTFSGNSATNGGGMIIILLPSTIYNSVFYGNGSDIENDSYSSTTGGNNFSEHYEETGFTALDADPFHRSSKPKGRDGVWFTDDDGLQPSSASSPITDAGDATKLPSDTSDFDKDDDTEGHSF